MIILGDQWVSVEELLDFLDAAHPHDEPRDVFWEAISMPQHERAALAADLR